MDLSIIIVNWNSKDYLRAAVSSIKAETRGIEFEIVVIDAASFDGCGEMLRREHPDVRFIQSAENPGFARANNEAFRVSRGRHLLFLNPDTEIGPRAIETLSHQLAAQPGAGIAGAKLLNSDRSVQESCIRAFPTIVNQTLDSALLRRLFPKARLWGVRPLVEGSATPQEVDAVSGACLMVTRQVFEQIGMFSADYFMYSEDIDLCLKARNAGFKTYYVPEAVVVHHGGGSSAQTAVSAFSSVMLLESRWRFFRKTRSVGYSRLYRLAMLGASAARVGAALLVWPARGLCGQEFQGRQIVKKWTARLRWTLGGERWVKHY